VGRLRLILLLLVALTTAASVRGQTPTGWRGDGSGRFPGADPVLTWSPKKNVVWKVELPGGSPASPVLVGDRLFVLSDPAVLLCVQASTGKILWQRGHLAADLGDGEGAKAGNDAPRHNPDGDAGSAASTPVSDGRHIFAMFANGVVSAHDLDGKRQWVRFIEKPKTGYGHASSPVLIGGKVIVQFLDVVALDAETGKETWRVKLPATHASPVVSRIGAMDLVVHPSGSILRAADGKVLAEKLFRLEQSSPVVHDGVIYAHENGKLKAFALPAKAGETLDVKSLWEAAAPRGQYQIASPVVHDGRVYGVSLNGIWQVTDCKTGQELYRERLPLAARVYASVHLAGEKLFVADQTGKTVVLHPGPHYKEVAINDLDYHPASFVFAGKRMYVRTHKHVYCVGE
jgi:outer membrane protein assembly factor BamB